MVNHYTGVKPGTLEARAHLLRFVRGTFDKMGIMEVETPILSRAGNSDPGIEQIPAGKQADFRLRTSPEYAMKRLLATDCGDIFELGKVFRSGESGRFHNPEFTMLEWYRSGMHYLDLMNEAARLVIACGREFDHYWRYRALSYSDVFLEATGVEPHEAGKDTLLELCGNHSLSLNSPHIHNRDNLLELLMSLVIQPALPAKTITAVYDYPSTQAALSCIRGDQPPVAERFELFLGSIELANGYQELTDHAEQRGRFESENQARLKQGKVPVTIDENLLAAMAQGLPECSGVALGLDRLLMACIDADSIAQVIAITEENA